MNISEFIKSKNFFPKYAPEVINWRHKTRGRSGRDEDLTFTEDDKKKIIDGIKKMADDITFDIEIVG